MNSDQLTKLRTGYPLGFMTLYWLCIWKKYKELPVPLPQKIDN